MNRRLFWKIFLPFWVAQALLLGVLYIRLQHRAHADNPWWVQPERRLVPTLADLAVHRYEDGGQPSLRALLDQSALPHRANYWLLDAAGRELSGRAMPKRFATTPSVLCGTKAWCGLTRLCSLLRPPPRRVAHICLLASSFRRACRSAFPATSSGC